MPILNETGHRCLVRIGTKPTVVRVRWHDGDLIDIRTKLEAMHRHHHHSSGEDDELINMLPFELELLDLEASLTVFDEVFGEDLEAVRVSAGVAAHADLFDQSTGLLSRWLNGMGPLFPVYVPVVMPQRSRRPPVKKLLRPSKPMDIRFTMLSKKASRLKGQVEIEMPREAIYRTKEEVKSRVKLHRQANRSLALLLAIQWDATTITLRYRESYARLYLHPGRVAFRFDSNLIRVDRDRHRAALPFTQILRAEFDIYAHPGQRMSTAVLRRIISNIVGMMGKKKKQKKDKGLMGLNGLRGLRQLISQLPNKVIQLEIAIDKESTSGKAEKLVRKSVKLRKGKAHKAQKANKEEVKSKSIKSFINMATLLNVSKMALERYGKSKSKSASSAQGLAKSIRKLNWSAIIEPGPHPSGPVVDVPCLFPRLCRDSTLLRQPPARRELASVRIYVRRIFQQLSDLAADLVVMGLDKLDLDRHPSALRLTLRLPSMHMAMCINDIDVVEIETQKLKLKRLTALNYPGLAPVRKEKHRHKSVKRDLAMIEALVKFGRNPQEITDLLYPITFDPTFAIVFDTPIQYARHGKPLYVHYSPMAMSMSTERVLKASLLSTLLAMGMPERPLSPMISRLEGLGVEMNLVGTEASQMQIKIGGVRLLQPIPAITVLIDQPIVVTMEFRGMTFLRVSLGKRLLIRHGYNQIEPVVTISKTAFGQLSPSHFSQDFADFMSCVIFGQACQIILHVRIGRQQLIRWPLWFPKRAVSLAIFDANQSDIDVWDVHDAQRHLKRIGGNAKDYGQWAWQKLSTMMKKDPDRTWNEWFKSWWQEQQASNNIHKQHAKRSFPGFHDSDDENDSPIQQNVLVHDFDLQPRQTVDQLQQDPALENEQHHNDDLSAIQVSIVEQHVLQEDPNVNEVPAQHEEVVVPLAENENEEPVAVEQDIAPAPEPQQAGRTWTGYLGSYVPGSIKNWWYGKAPEAVEQEVAEEEEPVEQEAVEEEEPVDQAEDLAVPPSPSKQASSEKAPTLKESNLFASLSKHLNDPPVSNKGENRILDGQWLEDAGRDQIVADRRIKQRQLLVREEDEDVGLWEEPDAEQVLQRLLDEEPIEGPPKSTAKAIPTSTPTLTQGKDCLVNSLDDLPALKQTWNTVYYKTFYMNPYAFSIKFVAMILNIRFAFDHGFASPMIERTFGVPTEPAEATMYILPQACLPYMNRQLKGPLDIVRCARQHLQRPPVTLPAGQGLGREGLANYRAPIQIKDARSLARLADEQAVGKHGLCIKVANSHVTVALEADAGKIGLAEAHRLGNPLLAGTQRTPTPFLLDLSLEIDVGIDKKDDPFADPCGRLYECRPQGISCKNIFVVMDVDRDWIWSSVTGRLHPQLPSDQHVLVDAQSQLHQQVLWTAKGIVLDSAWRMTTRIFVGHAHHHHHHHGKNQTLRQGQAQQSNSHHEGFGWLLRATWSNQPKGDLVQIWCHPQKGMITIERADRPCVIYRKQGGLVPLLRQSSWHHYTLIHRPASGGQGGLSGTGSLWLIIKEESSSSLVSMSFPLDLRMALGAPRQSRLRLGLKGSSGLNTVGKLRIHAHEWQVHYIEPDLSKSLLFWIEGSAVLAGETGMFLLQLRDNCGEVLGASPWGLSVQLRRVKSDRLKVQRHYDAYAIHYWANRPELSSSDSDSYSDSSSSDERRLVHSSDVQGMGKKKETQAMKPLSWIPPSLPVHCKSVYNPRSGAYEVYYRASQPGRYRVWVALRRRPVSSRGRDLGVGARQWVQLPHHHVYVRNLW